PGALHVTRLFTVVGQTLSSAKRLFLIFLLALPAFAQPWSFRNHVIPVLTKMGCNSGACHGALAGKNGFKLTLRGYDPDTDYDTGTIFRRTHGRCHALGEVQLHE